MEKPFLLFETEAEFERLLLDYHAAAIRMNVNPTVLARIEAGVRDFVNSARTWKRG